VRAVQSALPFESDPFGPSVTAPADPAETAASTSASPPTFESLRPQPPAPPRPPEPLRPPAHTLRLVPNFVRHPRARRYLIRVKPDGTVRVTIPRGGSKREAVSFVEAQRPWILEQQRKVARAGHVRGPLMTPERTRELRARASRELPVRLHELAARFGLTVTRVSIRNQRWRWGSCSRQGHICLNWRLIDMPCDVRDYVLIHELMHLRRMDHSPKFWAFVEAACPDYQQARRWLREHAGGLLEG
jgi:predicted metal-dependent hydrolase